MRLAIASLDGLTACLLFAASVVAALIDLLAPRPMRPWAYVTIAFLMLAVERGCNALEWAGQGPIELLDALEGYLQVLACMVLALVAIRFWGLVSRLKRELDD